MSRSLYNGRAVWYNKTVKTTLMLRYGDAGKSGTEEACGRAADARFREPSFCFPYAGAGFFMSGGERYV